jgi:hypothetical protein
MFGAYYRPSKDEFERLWKSGLITFDASFLLNLYHYSEPARNQNALEHADRRRSLSTQNA